MVEFETVRVSSFSGAALKRCPECFSLIEGEFAERHWNKTHSEKED